MPQDIESGREAHAFGKQMAQVVARQLGLNILDGKGNVVSVEGKRAVIKTARKSSYIGITKAMLPTLSFAYAAVPSQGPNVYDIFEVSREVLNEKKQEPGSEKSKGLWFLTVRNIRRYGRFLMHVSIAELEIRTPEPQPSIVNPVISDVDPNSICNLFATYNEVMKKLRDMGVIRSSNNPIGDYGEYLISRRLGLTLTEKSSQGVDAIDKLGIKYQIKSRRLSPENRSRQLGGFRDLNRNLFDFCLAGIFSYDFQLKELWKLPHDVIVKFAKPTTRGFDKIVLDGPILNASGVQNLI